MDKKHIDDILREIDNFFKSPEHEAIFNELFPKKLTFLQRIVAFVKNIE